MATLPSYVKISFDSYSQKRESGILRTDMESGPPRQARFKTRVMITRNAKLIIESKANFQAFETWFMNDLAGGSLFFNMTDPVSKQTIEARFVGGEYTATPMTSTLNIWQIDCQIENWSA